MKQLIPALFAVGAVMLLIGRLCYRLAAFALYIYDRCDVCCFGTGQLALKV